MIPGWNKTKETKQDIKKKQWKMHKDKLTTSWKRIKRVKHKKEKKKS